MKWTREQRIEALSDLHRAALDCDEMEPYNSGVSYNSAMADIACQRNHYRAFVQQIADEHPGPSSIDAENRIFKDATDAAIFYGNQAKNCENDPTMKQVFQASCETAALLLTQVAQIRELRERLACHEDNIPLALRFKRERDALCSRLSAIETAIGEMPQVRTVNDLRDAGLTEVCLASEVRALFTQMAQTIEALRQQYEVDIQIEIDERDKWAIRAERAEAELSELKRPALERVGLTQNK